MAEAIPAELASRTTREVFEDHLRLADGPMAFLEWTVDQGPYRIRDGADSYLVENGKIRMQTIHYTVEDEHGRVLIAPDGTRPEVS